MSNRFFGSKVFKVIASVSALLLFVVIGMFVINQTDSKEIKQVEVKPEVLPQVSLDFTPKLSTTEVLTGLSRPWDIVFLPDGTMLFNERAGTVSKMSGGKKQAIKTINDAYAVGEGGLTGLALDQDFSNNRFIYTCMNTRSSSGLDVRLIRWRLNESASDLTERTDIVTGIPSNTTGRHSGCRVRTAKDGTLWIGTGDAAKASNPQDPSSLGGKILHVTRDGMPAGTGLPAPFDPRIFSYGHRNVQGIVLFDKPHGDVYGYSIEHGSDRDDEINLLKNGNFGWAPRVTYIEAGVPMTDLDRFPDAISAIWSSGYPTIAPSGATMLTGEQWGEWDGALVMAVLKGKQVRLIQFDKNNSITKEEVILTDFGRVRSVTQGLDGSLYVSTDNQFNDKIIKISPSRN